MVTEAAASEALFAAIRAGDAARVEQLLAEQPKLATASDADGLSPLMTALYFNQSAIAQLLLARLPSDGLSLHEAAAVGAVPRLEQLLAADGGAVNAWSGDGFQPLGLAAFFGQAEAVDLLLARGGEVNTKARHRFGVTALHAALAGPKPAIARTLIKAGADVNALQNSGETALHATAFTGSVELTKLLLDHGANPNALDKDGHTPRDIAQQRGHTAVAEMLS